MLLSTYTVTLSPSRFAPASASPPNWGGLRGGEIESYQKIANGTYGEGLFYLCNYAGALKPLLDQHLEVTDDQGNTCYCGYIEEVYRCCGEYVAWGWNAATLFNRIAVTWSENGVTQITPYQEDSASILAHGLRELVLPLPVGGPQGALYTPLQYAQRLLKELSQPLPVLHNTYKCTCNLTYLRTQGYYNTLAWQTYRHPCGLADTGAAFTHGQPLGLGFTSNQLAINGGTDGASQLGIISDQLLAFDVGDTIIMRGWGQAQNNIATTITAFIKDDFESVISAGLTTSPPNFINDSHSSLKEFHKNEFIQVSGAGTGHLDGYYWVRAENDGPSLAVQHQSFGHANYTGTPVTITHGVTINVPSNLVQEDPGAWVTVKGWHQYLCQPVYNDCGASGEFAEPWTATHVAIGLRKVGNPTTTLAITIGPTCTTLPRAGGDTEGVATATISADMVNTTFGYVQVALSATVPISAGLPLYVQIHPTGPAGALAAPSITDYYAIAGSLAQTPSLKARTGPDGLTWTATAYTAAVRLLEYQSLTQQLSDLVSQGRFISSVAVLDQLAFPVPTYRNGYTSLRYAIEQLLTMGDPTGNRLQLTLDCTGAATIRTEPAADAEPCTTLTCCSTVTTPTGVSLSNPCPLTAGRWLCPEDGITDVPGVFLDSFYVSYKQCRLRFLDRTFSRTHFNQSLRYPGLI